MPTLTATYAHLSASSPETAPSNEPTFSHTLPSVPSSATAEERTSFLSALRESAVDLQAEINTFLTAKMEEDKAREGAAAGKKLDDEKEEENYGEEVVED